MSLFSSIQLANNTLQAMQIGLHVVGNNIANANTPGYIREEVVYAPAPVQEKGRLVLGLGVQVEGIVQKVDEFLTERLRGATSDRVNADLQNEAYKAVESLVGELTDSDLSTALTDFFGSVINTTNPVNGEALSTRNLTVLEGETLAYEFRRLDEQLQSLRTEYDKKIQNAASEINSLAEEIRDLNVKIVQTEGGGAKGSQAGALRTQRSNALDRLTSLIDAEVVEQPSGGLSISVGGEFLVFEGQRRDVTLKEGVEINGLQAATIAFEDTGKVLELNGGEVLGLTVARDEIVGGFREDLDQISRALIFEFNKIHSLGQGLDGFEDLTGSYRVTDADAALDEAGLGFDPEHGSFNLVVRNTNTGDENINTVSINLLDGPSPKTTLNSLAAQIDAFEGVSATVVDNRLRITGDQSVEFHFAKDPSNEEDNSTLAALGINTFFTGDSALDMGVNQGLVGIENAGKFAASNGGVGANVENALRLAGFLDEELDSLDGATLAEGYDQMINELAQGSSVAGSVAEGLGVFEATLASEFQSKSGVSIDEEAITMITLQRIYQASARYIQTIAEMLDTLVNL
ncbi:Flagellar hook-associated protein 1 [Pseudobythopirellula maris]|uniref:Flagellar hook-associated protein 1 n=1 Tax=Pseudobythopirellula maris TaxID=2527991 RepID=A0A5C5ZLE7_9BACT|nr:flagellar hook-associated protein FlgK [Pseudobythopirellula maris]TWT88219.1 Flagellar hook-associated protein 1 [Pseudobythopirellula maris]